MYFRWSNGVNTPLFNVYHANSVYYGTTGNAATLNPMYNGTSRFYLYNLSKECCPTNNVSWLCSPVNGVLRYTGEGYDDNTAITIPTSLSVAEFPDKNKTVTVNVQNFSNMFEGFLRMNCPITIPSGVVDMNYTFYNCQNFNQDIQIPNSVTKMNSTFYNCKNLIYASIGKNVEIIAHGAFCGCSELEEVDFSNKLTSIESSAFNACVSLAKVVIPCNVKNIGDAAFMWCSNLEELEIGFGVQSIGDYAFSQCSNLRHVKIPDNVTTLGFDAFKGCSRLLSAWKIPQKFPAALRTFPTLCE
jgi:hypothetical protein